MEQKYVDIVVNGINDGLSEDEIKVRLFEEGVPFSKLNKTYKDIAISQGLIVDPKVVREGIREHLEEYDWEVMDTWEDVSMAINEIVDAVEGATTAKVTAMVRSYCEAEEIALPKKPRGRKGPGRGGRLMNAIVQLATDNPDVTKEEAYDIIRPMVGGNKPHSNTLYYINNVLVPMLAVARKESLPAVKARFAAMQDPAGSDPVQEAESGIEE